MESKDDVAAAAEGGKNATADAKAKPAENGEGEILDGKEESNGADDKEEDSASHKNMDE